MIETRNKESLIVTPPTLDKYKISINNKGCFRWIFEQDEYRKKKFIVTKYHVI